MSQQNEEDWLDARAVTLISSALAFWLIVVLWPADLVIFEEPWRAAWPLRVLLVLIAIGLFVLAVFRRNKGHLTNGLLVVVGIFLIVVAFIMVHQVGSAETVRFAVGVGGLSIAVLLLGLRRFDTVRAASQLAVVILAIGVLTFPGAQAIVGSENVATIVGFLGLVIGVNGAAEAAVQISAARGAGDSAEKARRAGDAVGTPEPPVDQSLEGSLSGQALKERSLHDGKDAR